MVYFDLIHVTSFADPLFTHYKFSEIEKFKMETLSMINDTLNMELEPGKGLGIFKLGTYLNMD